MADRDAERLVKSIYNKAQQVADKKGDREYVVKKATKALINLTRDRRERGLDTPIPLKDIQQHAGILGTTGIWPWIKKNGADVVRKEPGLQAFKIRDEYCIAMEWLNDAIIEPPTKHRILDLQGLGKEVWAGIDAQAYVNRERSARAG